MARLEWKEQAACRGLDTNVFFSDDEAEVAQAKAVCAGCPVREACLQFALDSRQHDGVWGGLDELERRRLRRRRQSGAEAA
ncbi:MAG TPA: WhiB family transcriptional regulator [Acidimicrobiales bacterium]|nr:WhiB family transcriptional regulator [Acidimicrobiales bacterium]